MAIRDPLTLLRLYEEGNITETEMMIHLIWGAAVGSPEKIAANLPVPLIESLRGRSASPPATIEQTPRVFYIGSSVQTREDEIDSRKNGLTRHERQQAKERRQTFEGLWAWHRYFESHPPQSE
jgi:hypothetical protein